MIAHRCAVILSELHLVPQTAADIGVGSFNCAQSVKTGKHAVCCSCIKRDSRYNILSLRCIL